MPTDFAVYDRDFSGFSGPDRSTYDYFHRIIRSGNRQGPVLFNFAVRSGLISDLAVSYAD